MARLQEKWGCQGNSGSDRARGRLNSLRRARRYRKVIDSIDLYILSGDPAERLQDWGRVEGVEGILKMMRIIIKGFEVLWWKVEVFPSDSSYFFLLSQK